MRRENVTDHSANVDGALFCRLLIKFDLESFIALVSDGVFPEPMEGDLGNKSQEFLFMLVMNLNHASDAAGMANEEESESAFSVRQLSRLTGGDVASHVALRCVDPL